MDTGSELYFELLQGEGDCHLIKIFGKEISGHVTHQMKSLEKPPNINANQVLILRLI